MFGRPDATLASPSRRHGWLHLLTFASNGLTVFSTGGRDELGGAGSSLGLNLHEGRESGDRGTKVVRGTAVVPGGRGSSYTKDATQEGAPPPRRPPQRRMSWPLVWGPHPGNSAVVVVKAGPRVGPGGLVGNDTLG